MDNLHVMIHSVRFDFLPTQWAWYEATLVNPLYMMFQTVIVCEWSVAYFTENFLSSCKTRKIFDIWWNLYITIPTKSFYRRQQSYLTLLKIFCWYITACILLLSETRHRWTGLKMVPRNPDSKSAKIQNSLCQFGGGGGSDDQLPTFDAESKSAKNQIFLWGGGGEGGGEGPVTNFQLLMLSPNLLKSYVPYVEGLAENFLSFWAHFVLVDYKWSLYTSCTRDHN